LGHFTRRRFVYDTALAAAALSACPMRALADSQTSAAGAPDAAPPTAAVIRDLASKISGKVITPNGPDYESARVIFNRAFDRHPALIVRCAGPTDVARALDFAQEHNLTVAVRGGGHNRAGLSICDGGVVIDLSLMRRIEVDPAKRVARAEAGALTVELDAATQKFGLATTLAGCPMVGIAGLTLGGGEGFLMSKYGTACDNLISAQLVTVDGRQIEANQTTNQDLFWAIRGGGGNFGIATALEFQLHPVTDVLAGTILYSAEKLPDLLHSFVQFVETAPDEMNVVGIVLPSKQGRRFLVLVCHCGDPHHGDDLLKPLRALNPQDDKIRIASYLQTNATINPAAPGAHFQTDLLLPELGPAAIEAITTATNDDAPDARVFIVPIYGAVTRVGVTDTAFPLRQRGYELDIMGRWDVPADQQRAVQWVKALRDHLQPLSQGAYVNQLGETSDSLVRVAYGPNYTRLGKIKKKFDPANVLRSNQNIRPL
jgi:hypothetical protein